MSPLIGLFTRNNGALTAQEQIANNQNNGRMGFQRGYPHNGYIPPQDIGALSQNPSQAELIGNRAKFDINTGNARGSTFSEIPNMKIGLPESLIRMGGNVMGASQQGALAGINAGTNTYGDIMDYNRAREAEAFSLEEARRAELADRMAASAALKAENAPDTDTMDTVNSQVQKMEQALVALQRGGLTGFIDGTLIAALESQTTSPKTRSRLLLKELRVDDALRRISQTKGAISNKEMDLFLSPAPSLIWNQEGTWIDWIKPRLEALRAIQARQRQGVILRQGTGDNDAAATGRYTQEIGGSWFDDLDDQTKADIIAHSNKP